jgi:hypothetical protein
MRSQNVALDTSRQSRTLIPAAGEGARDLRCNREFADRIIAHWVGLGYVAPNVRIESYRLRAGVTIHGLRSDMLNGLPRQRLHIPH